jgi:hypothetical protein
VSVYSLHEAAYCDLHLYIFLYALSLILFLEDFRLRYQPIVANKFILWLREPFALNAVLSASVAFEENNLFCDMYDFVLKATKLPDLADRHFVSLIQGSGHDNCRRCSLGS